MLASSYFVGFVRLILTGVFAVAGVAKLLDREGAQRAVKDFGIAPGLSSPLGIAIPVAELGVAAALLFERSAVAGGAGALALLGLFIGAIAVNLARGRTPDCHCFGQLNSEPVSRTTIIRNVVLALLALAVVGGGMTDPGPSFVAWLVPLAGFERAVLAIGCLITSLLAWQVVLLTRLLREQQQQVRVTPDSVTDALVATPPAPVLPTVVTLPAVAGHPAGTLAPSFALPGMNGATVTLDDLRADGKPVVLVFSDPGCGPCADLLPEVADWQHRHADLLTVALISRGTVDENSDKVTRHGLQNVLLQRDREVMEAFAVVGTPSAVLVHADGAVGSFAAQAEVEIRRLITQWTARSSDDGVQPGLLTAAPHFMLPDVHGRAVALSAFAGVRTLLLFWNPECRFSQAMLAELREWERLPLTERPQLVVISTGTADRHVGLDVRSTVLLDTHAGVARQYGVSRTPSAVLVDAGGQLASPVAPGATRIFELVGRRTPAAMIDPGQERTLTGGRVREPMTFPVDVRPIRQDCVVDELLPDGSIVLYNGCQKRVMTLNGTGALVWDCCDGELDVDGIVAEVREVFPSAIDIESDVRTMLDTLAQAAMITPAVTSALPHAVVPASRVVPA